MAATLVLLPALIDMVPKAMNPCDMGRAYELPVTSTSPALRSCDMDKCNTMSAVSTPLNLLLLDEFIDDSYTIFDPGAFCGSSADHSIAQNMSGGPCATRDPSLACSSVLEDALFKPWHAASDTLRGRAQKWAGWFASHAIQTTHTFLHFGDVQYARLRRARTPNIHLIREDVTLNASMTPSDTSATVSPSILGPGAARVAKVGRARSVVEPSRNTLCASLAHTDCNHNHSILHDYISATTVRAPPQTDYSDCVGLYPIAPTCKASTGVSGASKANVKQVSFVPARDKIHKPSCSPACVPRANSDQPRLCPRSPCGQGSPEAASSWLSSTSPLSCIVLVVMYALWRTGEKSYCAHGSIINSRMLLKVLILAMMITVSEAPPATRGSGAGSSSSGGVAPSINDLIPNTQRDYDFLPGMKRWNGIPFIDFTRVWMLALCIALGTISMDGITLLTTAEGNDPHAGSADAVEQGKFKQRSLRVYSCIMNYIKTNSRCARIANKEFPGDGPGLFKWLKVWGQLQVDPETKQELLNEWEDASMAKVGIKNNDPEAIWKWLEYLEEFNERIPGGKSLSQVRKKFLDGFPEWFDVVISAERLKPDPGSYTIPNNYPPEHPKAGTNHPDRGKPDLHAMAVAFDAEWKRRCKRIKSAPRGSVYQAQDCDEDSNDDDSDSDERAHAVSRSAINAAFICVICGGRGHAASVEGMDCLTKQLGISIPRPELAATKYPNGLKFPSLPNKRRESARYSRQSSSSRGSTSRSDEKSKQKVKFSKEKKHQVKHKSVRQVESEPETSEAESEQQDVSDSSASDSEAAAKFAVTYHTITTSGKYNSMSDDSESDDNSKTTTKPKSKSATTKANKK